MQGLLTITASAQTATGARTFHIAGAHYVFETTTGCFS